MLTLSTLRTSTRAASLTEYVALTGLLGVVAIGAVLAFGAETTRAPEAATAALASIATPEQAQGPAPAPGGGSGTPGGGTVSPPPPADPFAVCDAYAGPFPAETLRGSGALVGGDDEQTFLGLAGAMIDGGEGGTDWDMLYVPGPAVLSLDPMNPESGTVDFPFGGALIFTNLESVEVCE